jgi:two-component system response regulator AtoC
VRVIAASNRNVLEEVVAGRFREDLYYRLKGSEIFLPALKERREDIEPLANYFANVTVKETKKPVGFSRAAMTALQNYEWPGNVRELQFAVDSAVQRCNGIVLISDLPNEVAQGDLRADELPVVGNPSLRCLEDASNDHILRVLRLCRGNKSKAADILKINRTTIMRLSKKKGWEDRFASEWAISD